MLSAKNDTQNRRPQIVESMDNLNNSSHRIYDNVKQLRDKLTPILRKNNLVCGNNSPTPCDQVVELACSINENTDLINQSNNIILELLDLIEL